MSGVGGKKFGEHTSFPTSAAAVTPSDATVFSEPSTVFVGGAGNVAVMPWIGSTAVTFVGLLPGDVVPVLVKQVMSTSTTATSIVRVYVATG